MEASATPVETPPEPVDVTKLPQFQQAVDSAVDAAVEKLAAKLEAAQEAQPAAAPAGNGTGPAKGDTVLLELEVVKITEDDENTVLSLAPVGQKVDAAWLHVTPEQLAEVTG